MSKKKMGLSALILMIFTSVFGFTNITKAFYLMGYASILWYILGAVCFFIPYAFMLSEYGAAFKDSKGGIFSWMEASVGPKYAFVVTFMWYASYIIWMVNVGIGIWIPLSNAIFGDDKTQSWSLFGLNGVQTIGILGILWIITLTIISSKGLDKIKKVTSVGGTAVALINVVLFIVGFIILILNKGQFAEPVTASAMVTSPNPEYGSIISIFSFLVFAIFAYGGLEAVAGVVDETENAEVTFPKGIIWAAIVIAVGYAIGIFVTGVFTNWTFAFNDFPAMNGVEVNMGNVSYIMMKNMGYQLGLAMGVSEATAMTIGAWVSRYMGISMFLALSGGFFTLIFSPLKQLIEGTPKALWPKSWTVTNEAGMPVNAMRVQAVIVILIMALVSFGGNNAKAFFDILIAMTNVSMTLPYMFIAIAFISFKKKKEIHKPFEIYKSEAVTKLAVYVVTFVVGFANVFTIINPAMNGRLSETIWSVVGPSFFTVVALVMYSRYEKKENLK